MNSKPKTSPFTWFVILLAALFFLLPIYGTLDFSLRAQRDTVSLLAYQHVLDDPAFVAAFLFSVQRALLTIVASFALVVPTAYWVHLRMPSWRPVLEFISLMPFVIPPIVLVFGLIRTFGPPPFQMMRNTFSTDVLMVAGYIVITLPYVYRAVDAGLRAMDVRTLTEAAQSLGAGWFTVIWRVVFPNLRGALISGALITFATVIGELILASFLARPAFGPYMDNIGRAKAYEPAALAIISYALTWASLALIDLFAGRNAATNATVR